MTMTRSFVITPWSINDTIAKAVDEYITKNIGHGVKITRKERAELLREVATIEDRIAEREAEEAELRKRK